MDIEKYMPLSNRRILLPFAVQSFNAVYDSNRILEDTVMQLFPYVIIECAEAALSNGVTAEKKRNNIQ